MPYLRVSTQRQGESGLGIEAQRLRVQQLAASRGAVLLPEFVEIESGRRNDRPQLAAALAEARRRKAAVVVAKLDRIARDAEFILRLSREAMANGMGGFLFADLPEVDATTAAGRMMLTVMASVAEFESRRISERTREAMAQAKLRGAVFGGVRPGIEARNAATRAAADRRAAPLRPALELMTAQRMSYRQMAERLALMGQLSQAGTAYSPAQVRRLCLRLELIDSHLVGKPNKGGQA